MEPSRKSFSPERPKSSVEIRKSFSDRARRRADQDFCESAGGALAKVRDTPDSGRRRRTFQWAVGVCNAPQAVISQQVTQLVSEALKLNSGSFPATVEHLAAVAR